MRKIFLVLLPVILLFVSCEEIAFPGLSFDYDYEFVSPFYAPIEAGQSTTLAVELADNRMGDELAKRGIEFVDDVRVNSLTLTIPEDSEIDFTYLSDFSATLVVDEVEYPLDFADQVPELAISGGKKIFVEADETIPNFAILKDAETISLVYTVGLAKKLKRDVEITATINTTVVTAFVE